MDEANSGAERVYVTTQEALAAHLGFDRKSIQRWQKRPDCPGKVDQGFDVEAWRAFVEKNKLGRKPTKSKSDLDNEKLALQNERLRIGNAKLLGELASVTEVAKTLADMVSGFKLTLTQAEFTIAEELVGVDVGEGVKRLKRRNKEILETLALGAWAQKKTFWSKVSAELSLLLETPGLGLGPKST